MKLIYKNLTIKQKMLTWISIFTVFIFSIFNFIVIPSIKSNKELKKEIIDKKIDKIIDKNIKKKLKIIIK